MYKWIGLKIHNPANMKNYKITIPYIGNEEVSPAHILQVFLKISIDMEDLWHYAKLFSSQQTISLDIEEQYLEEVVNYLNSIGTKHTLKVT